MFVCMREGEREKEGERERDAFVMHVCCMYVWLSGMVGEVLPVMQICVHACSYIEPEVIVFNFIGFLRMPISKVILSAYVKSDFQTWFGELKKTAQAADDEDR